MALGAEMPPATRNGGTKVALARIAVVNVGSPKGRESYGDGVPVCSRRRNDPSNLETGRTGPQGEGAQAMNDEGTMRNAECRKPEWYSAFSASAAGRACRARSFTGRCSTGSCT